MPAGIMTTSTAPRLLKIGLRKVFFDEFDHFENEYQSLFNVETSTKYQEEDVTMGMMEEPITKAEGVGITYYTPSQGHYKQYTWVEYASGFRVTRVMRDDDQYRVVERMPRTMATGMQQVIETVGQNVLNNGFTGGTYALPNGQALFSESHTDLLGATNPNKPATDVDITPYQVQALLTILEGITDFNGYQIVSKPKWLFGHYGQRFKFDEILGSPLKAYTSDNTKNVLRGGLSGMGGGLLPLSLHYVSDTDMWGIQAEQHFMYFFWRVMKEFTGPFQDTDTFDEKYRQYARFGCGATTYQGIVATSGG